MASINPQDPRRRTARQGGLGLPNQTAPTPQVGRGPSTPRQGTPGQMPSWGGQPSGPLAYDDPNGPIVYGGARGRSRSPYGDFPRNEPRVSAPPANGAAFTGGDFQKWFMDLQQQSGQPYDQNWLNSIEDLLGQSGSKLTPANAGGERTKIWDPTKNDWVRVGFGEGRPVWNYQNWGENGQGAGGGVFNDPATAQWEQLLRGLVDRLNQPQPTYTDAQRDLMQTQAIDPLERSRQAQRQNTTERLAARGINPGSGVLEQALRDVDRQFDQMKTGQQSQFALNQIGREDQMFNSNEQRALAGLNLFSQIPQYADKRLQMAQGSLMGGNNPAQLLSLMNQYSQQGQNQQNYQSGQDQQFWLWLGQMLSNSFGNR